MIRKRKKEEEFLSRSKKILKLLYDVSKKHNKLVIVVTHNSALKDMADKVIHIKNGKVENIEVNKNPTPIEDIEW